MAVVVVPPSGRPASWQAAGTAAAPSSGARGAWDPFPTPGCVPTDCGAGDLTPWSKAGAPPGIYIVQLHGEEGGDYSQVHGGNLDAAMRGVSLAVHGGKTMSNLSRWWSHDTSYSYAQGGVRESAAHQWSFETTSEGRSPRTESLDNVVSGSSILDSCTYHFHP